MSKVNKCKLDVLSCLIVHNKLNCKSHTHVLLVPMKLNGFTKFTVYLALKCSWKSGKSINKILFNWLVLHIHKLLISHI